MTRPDRWWRRSSSPADADGGGAWCRAGPGARQDLCETGNGVRTGVRTGDGTGDGTGQGRDPQDEAHDLDGGRAGTHRRV
ncbi:hypothetical protein SCWH03_34550 [Streptomyces pacificus]|uniref:Uncharacterized protein n=1 Tax=Streptomyces pacificus TaxID=2705029 RepID=A0A6A0AWB9_9ACTN|nr:hypothetical protein SCWH03_34550 [Streptomyces pacificus]